jgi:hypothetical protein
MKEARNDIQANSRTFGKIKVKLTNGESFGGIKAWTTSLYIVRHNYKLLDRVVCY